MYLILCTNITYVYMRYRITILALYEKQQSGSNSAPIFSLSIESTNHLVRINKCFFSPLWDSSFCPFPVGGFVALSLWITGGWEWVELVCTCGFQHTSAWLTQWLKNRIVFSEWLFNSSQLKKKKSCFLSLLCCCDLAAIELACAGLFKD